MSSSSPAISPSVPLDARRIDVQPRLDISGRGSPAQTARLLAKDRRVQPRCSTYLGLPSAADPTYVVSLDSEGSLWHGGAVSGSGSGISTSRRPHRRGQDMTSKILLSGGCVLTLGTKTPNFNRADVLIDAGVVVQVGTGLRARDAERVDATDTIVMPGFVDTHRHAWTSLFRNVREHSENGESPVPAEVADHYQPEDVYAATLIGVLGAAEAGITTVVDWSPIRPDAGFAEAALQAHADAGVRTVFVHAGRRRTEGNAGPAIREIVARLTGAAGPMTSVALGFDVPGSADLDAVAEGWAAARELGMRIHAHAGSRELGARRDRRSRRPWPLGRGRHARALRWRSTTRTSMPSRLPARRSPWCPRRGGERSRIAPDRPTAGRPRHPAGSRGRRRMRHAGRHVRADAGDELDAARHGVRSQVGGESRRAPTDEHARHDPLRHDRRRAGRGVGWRDRITRPGKRADVIVLRTDRPNVFPINDPIGAVVWGMDTSNVDMVFVDGACRDARRRAGSRRTTRARAGELRPGAGGGRLRSRRRRGERRASDESSLGARRRRSRRSWSHPATCPCTSRSRCSPSSLRSGRRRRCEDPASARSPRSERSWPSPRWARCW